MATKEIVQLGNPKIRKVSRKLTLKEINSSKIKNLIKNLNDSMIAGNLIGISAPQIGENLRMFITEIRPTKTRKPKDLDGIRIFINPKITQYSKDKCNGYEGCGSVANSNLFGIVKRSKSVVIKATNENGKNFELKASGLLARVIQHEYDHLDGILFIDRVTNTRSYMSGSEYRKMKNKKSSS